LIALESPREDGLPVPPALLLPSVPFARKAWTRVQVTCLSEWNSG